jgi:hypothetical protein
MEAKMVSKKQLKANRKNAKKGGVKTETGKAISKYNALKHGLLAKEVVVDAGDGAENPEEFQALLSDLVDYFKPNGSVEEILVEKIAASYWRLRRCHKYEVGLIRSELDTLKDKFYDDHSTDEEIDEEIREAESEIKSWQSDKKELSKMYKKGTDLEEIYDWQVNWKWLQDKFSDLIGEIEDEPVNIRKDLNQEDYSDDEIWQAHIELCDERAAELTKEIEKLKRDKKENKLSLQVKKKLASIPTSFELGYLLRYEIAIERQLYKALNQLERMQRFRAGDNVPAPIKIDLDLNNPTNA